MASITKLEFHNADTPPRRLFVSIANCLHGLLLNQKRPGDSVKVHFDDGTIIEHTMGAGTVTDGGWEIPFVAGVES